MRIVDQIQVPETSRNNHTPLDRYIDNADNRVIMNDKNNSAFNKLAVAILIGSFVIAIAILVNSFIGRITNEKNISNNPKKIYENITYVKTAGSPFLGNADAPITVIEYIDFECPICKRVYDEIMPQLKSEYINTNKVKFVFKSLPIEDIHKTAYIKTEAALCAYDQGGNTAFFRYHDELFNRFYISPTLSVEEELVSIASQNGLNQTVFRDCLNSKKTKPVIQKDIVETIAINAGGTPTWLIGKSSAEGLTDTVKLNGLHGYFVYKTVIDQLIKNN